MGATAWAWAWARSARGRTPPFQASGWTSQEQISSQLLFFAVTASRVAATTTRLTTGEEATWTWWTRFWSWKYNLHYSLFIIQPGHDEPGFNLGNIVFIINYSLFNLDMMNQAGFYGLNADTNMCKPDKSFTWCLPADYNQEKHPFTCRNP